jgi:hypothetical protein
LGTVNRLMDELEISSRPDAGTHVVCRRRLRPETGKQVSSEIEFGAATRARRDAQAARQYIEQHFDQSLENLFRGAGRVCRATRGVVMALARFDSERQKVTLAGIGNIELRPFASSTRFSPSVRRGIVGLHALDPACFDHPWTADCVLVLYSDGLRTRWSGNDFPELFSEPPAKAAHRLLTVLANPDDDATVVVVRSKRS